MQIIHRISFIIKDRKILSKLKEMNIFPIVNPMVGSKNLTITFNLSESDNNWEEIIKLVKKNSDYEPNKPGDIVETVFSEDEVRNANWLRMISVFEQGYPMPTGTWPIKQNSFTLHCEKCCIYEQTKEMRLKKEPTMRKNSFLATIWTNELFCTQDVFEEFHLHNFRGYEIWDVLQHKDGEKLKTIKQLYIPTVMQPGFIPDKIMPNKICPICGTVKYNTHVRGIVYIKKEILPSDLDFVLTNEWFGQGYLSWREIIVSNRVANLILDKGWKGIRFKVVKPI